MDLKVCRCFTGFLGVLQVCNRCDAVNGLIKMFVCVFILQEKFTQVDILILMTAAVCHDLDHPGFNNT